MLSISIKYSCGRQRPFILLLAIVLLVLPAILEQLNSNDPYPVVAFTVAIDEATAPIRRIRRPRRKLGVRTRKRHRHTSQRKLDMPMTGGYSPVPDLEENIVITEAAAFVLEEVRKPSSPHSIGSLSSQDVGNIVGVRILEASQQVVAGLNIRLTLAFEDDQSACLGSCTVVVYDHFGDLSITTWREEECKGLEARPVSDVDDTKATTSDTSAADNDDKSAVIILEDFSSPLHVWKELNDPVMGGKSTGTFYVENGVGRFVGEVVDVPFLKAAGFIKGHTTDHKVFPDVTSCQALQIIARSKTEYTGYRISFGNAHAPGGNFFAFGYKSSMKDVPTDDFGEITIPFSEFTDFWDDATGEPIHTCKEDSRFCPSKMNLKNVKLLEIWGEGVRGSVDLEIKRIQAVGCNSNLI
mmetsp:Transcript_13809/g.29014  ORF Transcript_13809/g.29014 Transcript_13809/m.29014 type:complete len:411 (-) Transcript_13809:1549-2781(-)